MRFVVPATYRARNFACGGLTSPYASCTLPEVEHESKHFAGKRVVASITMTREQHDALKALAARENRTVSQQVRHLIERATEKQAA